MAPTLAFVIAAGLSLGAADIQPGTHALLQLETNVTTRTAKAGDPVALRTASEIVVDGVAIPIGSPAQGVVSRSKRPGRVRGRGELEVQIVSITRPNGATLPVTASFVFLPPPQIRPLQPPPPTVPITVGMVAGYGSAALVSKVSNSEDTIVRTGVVAGLATGILVGVMKRGEDLVVRRGLVIDVVFGRP